MFVCEKCAEKRLSDIARSVCFYRSFGPCELCGNTASCYDVHSGNDALWKPIRKAKAKKRKPSKARKPQRKSSGAGHAFAYPY